VKNAKLASSEAPAMSIYAAMSVEGWRESCVRGLLLESWTAVAMDS
jgi:hypothetical protein